MRGNQSGFFERLKERGVLRVAFSYAVIGWLLLQIGDVVLDPLDAPGWVMKALILLLATGFPIALVLAWHFELGPAGISLDQQTEGESRPATPGIRRYADALTIAVLLAVIVLLLARQSGLLEDEAGTPVIGVLPFTELGVPEAETYFGAGLADTLGYKLGQLKQILVLAPSSTREFGGPGQDLAKIGALLGASALLEGTVRRSTGSLKVNARLVDIVSGQQLWSGSYDRTGIDLFAVQDEIATAVTEALHLVLSPEDTGRVTHTLTANLSAYDAYLLGHARMATRNKPKMVESVNYFRQATHLDPDYALAHAALAEAIYLSSVYSEIRVDWSTVRAEAQTAAAQAQLLDAAGGDGYLAQAFVAMGDNDIGDGKDWPREYIATLLMKAVELSPNNASALKFAASYADSETERLELLQRAAQLDPRSGIIQMNLGDALARSGDKEGAMRHYLASIGVSGGDFVLAQMTVPFMLQFNWGQVDEAARFAGALNHTYPNRDNTIGLLRALLGLGAWDKLEQVLNHPSAEVPYDDPVLLRQRIVLSLVRNDCDEVERAVVNFEQKLRELGGQSPQNVPAAVILESARTAQGLCRIRNGQLVEARELLVTAQPELSHLAFPNIAALALRSQILLAALYKANGQVELAQQLLEQLLTAAADVPLLDIQGVGFTRFMALAVAGQPDAALTELTQVADQGWTADWWLLDALAFDPDYARVMADPRFKAIDRQLQNRVQEMRESYLANPSPSAEDLQLAGIQPID